MAEITFFIQADPKFTPEGEKPKYRVRPYFSFRSMRPDGSGGFKEEFDFGLVDDDIKAQNKDEWGKFETFYNAHDTKLNAEAIKTPGVPYKFDYTPAPAPEPVKVTVKPKKGLLDE